MGKRLNEGLIPFCESKGLKEVRRLRHVVSHFNAVEYALVDNWIAVKEAELRDEAISISRWALRTSISAFIFSIIAIAINSSEKISQFILWFSK